MLYNQNCNFVINFNPCIRIYLTLWFILLLGWCLPATAQYVLTTEIQGVDKPLLKNIKARLKVLEASEPVTPALIQSWVQQAPRNIRLSLQPYGYFSPKISISLSKKRRLPG